MRYTLVPSHFEESNLSSPAFSRQDFHHVNKEKRDEMARHGAIECLDANRAVWRYTSRKAVTRGFSARYGEYLAEIKTSSIGRLILSEITRNPMEEPIRASL